MSTSAPLFHVTRGETLVLTDDEAGSTVSLVPARGAIVTRFRAAGRELLYLDEATLHDPAKNVRGGIPVLFPSPGKLDGDQFARGEAGALKQHGFARDLPWEVQDARTSGAAGVTLTLASNERTRAAYPWDFRMAIDFTLRGGLLRLGVRVENTGDGTMPFAFGLHPYFLVADKARAKIATRATRAFDNVTKEVVPFRGFDLTAREVDLHLIDHGSTDSALAWGDGAPPAVRGSPEMTRWVVWTVAGKDYVCLEPWTAPANALNTGESLLELAPGEARELWVELEYARG